MPIAKGLGIKRRMKIATETSIDMKKLQYDELYFIRHFKDGRIGLSYLFTPRQIEWLELYVGEDWNKKFAQNVFVGRIESARIRLPSQLRNLAKM